MELIFSIILPLAVWVALITGVLIATATAAENAIQDYQHKLVRRLEQREKTPGALTVVEQGGELSHTQGGELS